QPLHHTRLERAFFGSIARQTTLELGHRCAFVEERPPVFAGPSLTIGPEDSDDLSLVPREKLQHRRRGPRRRLQYEIVTIENNIYVRGSCSLQSFDSAHSLALQSSLLRIDWACSFASAPSAAISTLLFSASLRTIGSAPLSLASSSWVSVCTATALKPL